MNASLKPALGEKNMASYTTKMYVELKNHPILYSSIKIMLFIHEIAKNHLLFFCTY